VKWAGRHFRGFTLGGGRLGNVVESTVVIVTGGSSNMAIANAF
tara:strand:- start:1043 stop:1171 length:129 start_codon:yes stop_codon:yes gene_type:complete